MTRDDAIALIMLAGSFCEYEGCAATEEDIRWALSALGVSDEEYGRVAETGDVNYGCPR